MARIGHLSRMVARAANALIPIVHHPRYDVTAFGLERFHPFDGRKYGRIRDALIDRGLRRPTDFARPRAISSKQLLAVHSREYLRSLRRRRILAGILEVPLVTRLPAALIAWRILRPMRLATGGMLLAARLALEHGLAINLGGGYHHASASSGGGFCVYADLPIAAKLLHDEGKTERVLVVDLDAHQGNGTASVLARWPWAAIYDIYQDDIFPARKEPEDFSHPVSYGLTGAEYLDLVERTLPAALDEFRPDLVFYNAGSDPFVGDPLAGLRLTAADLVDRDLRVVTLVQERGIPLVMALSGGYSGVSWRIHADAIEAILTRFDRR